jgi:2-oxoglutarate ferredoxin oxidoreductase subunit beta
MSVTEVPKAPAKNAKVNRIGLEMKAYQAAESTLCAGCGHDAITSSIIKAFYDSGVEPHRVAKMSGIGCSSKTTAYFLGQSHGINSVHGRMSAVATGAMLANRTLVNIGISGDGDTASIGLGNFLHMVRRNVPIIYVIENNGCYGLTKGQFSATADKGSVKKGGLVNENLPIDCCALAIQMGCGFVARTFSGDVKQVRSLMRAAIAYRGTALLDIVSPCVTFNNHEGSTKSLQYAKDNEDPLHEIGFVPHFEQTLVDYDEGTTKVVKMPDGSNITLSKIDPHNYDPRMKMEALALLDKAREGLQFYTGLIYYNDNVVPMDEQYRLVDAPLATLPESRTRPSRAVFDELIATFK